MLNRRIALAVLVVVGTMGIASSSAGQMVAPKINHLTLNTPVRLPGVVLLPGSYAFESGPLGMHPGIVRVTSPNKRTLYYQGFTQAVQRADRADWRSVLSFGEAPADAPKPIAAWFPLGSQLGHGFIYR